MDSEPSIYMCLSMCMGMEQSFEILFHNSVFRNFWNAKTEARVYLLLLTWTLKNWRSNLYVTMAELFGLRSCIFCLILIEPERSIYGFEIWSSGRNRSRGRSIYRYSTAAAVEEPITPPVQAIYTQHLINGQFVDAASGIFFFSQFIKATLEVLLWVAMFNTCTIDCRENISDIWSSHWRSDCPRSWRWCGRYKQGGSCCSQSIWWGTMAKNDPLCQNFYLISLAQYTICDSCLLIYFRWFFFPFWFQERSRILLRFADLVEKHNDELAALETWNNGKPYEQSAKSELPMLSRLFHYYAGGIHKILAVASLVFIYLLYYKF